MVGVTGSIPVAPTRFAPSGRPVLFGRLDGVFALWPRGDVTAKIELLQWTDDHESAQLSEIPADPSPGQPHRAPQGPRVHHQQNQPPLQSPPGLKLERVGVDVLTCGPIAVNVIHA